MTADNFLIDIQDLVCGYGNREVLQGLNLRLQAGEMVGILGPNGSGKSTFLLALAGVIPPISGSIRVAGRDLSQTTARWRSRQMASVPQKAAVSFPFRCLSVVLMGRYPYLQGWGDYSREDRDIALQALEQTRTLPLAQRYMHEISGGEAQMIMIARALTQETPILLLDEATSSLDVAHKIQIFDLLREKNRQGSTLLCVMHDLNLAALYCPRLIFLKQGRIILDGPTDETFNDKNLSEIYATEIRVASHPITGSPQAHFVPGINLPGRGNAALLQSGLEQ